MSYSPWSHKELDTAEQLSLHLNAYHVPGTSGMFYVFQCICSTECEIKMSPFFKVYLFDFWLLLFFIVGRCLPPVAESGAYSLVAVCGLCCGSSCFGARALERGPRSCGAWA